MRTVASVQLAMILLAATIVLSRAQPIPLGIFFNLQKAVTVASTPSTACTTPIGTLDFTNTGTNCNIILYVLLF